MLVHQDIVWRRSIFHYDPGPHVVDADGFGTPFFFILLWACWRGLSPVKRLRHFASSQRTDEPHLWHRCARSHARYAFQMTQLVSGWVAHSSAVLQPVSWDIGIDQNHHCQNLASEQSVGKAGSS